MPDRYRSKQPVHLGGREGMDGYQEAGEDMTSKEMNGSRSRRWTDKEERIKINSKARVKAGYEMEVKTQPTKGKKKGKKQTKEGKWEGARTNQEVNNTFFSVLHEV